MGSYSRVILSDVFKEIIQWTMRKEMIPDQVQLHWNELHLSVVQSYVLNSGFNFDPMILTIAKLLHGTLWCDMPESPVVYAKMVVSFTQVLRRFFVVPRQNQLLNRDDNNLKRSELVAAFVDFLLRLLHYKTDCSGPFEDRIASLEKELRFLLTVLGDTLRLDDEHEQAQNLLAEFEAAANEAGTLLHSFFFSKNRVFKAVDEGFGAALEKINLLKGNVIKFLDLLPSISRDYIAPETTIVDLLRADSLLYDLEELLSDQDNSRIDDLKDQIKTLHQGLIFLQSLVTEVGGPEPSEIEELKESLMGIRDVVYGVDYLIKSFLVGDVPLRYVSIRLSHFTCDIKRIGIQLQEIKKNYDTSALKVAGHLRGQLSLQGTRNSEDSEVTVGWEEKEMEILDQLLGITEHLQVICIYGMPGLGKTTFAKKLYNHPSALYRFDKRSWCVVSQTYDRHRILVEVLTSLASELNKNRILGMEGEDLIENIYKILKGRRYLIVLDDSWSSNVWYDLRRCFPNDGNGSRILFTSRNKDVAPLDSIIHELPFLSDEKCWELLEKKVFHNKPCPPELLGIGKDIAKNCCGLPLAVVVIAGILSATDKEETTWRKVGVSLGSYIFSDPNNRVMQILELSYKHLPTHLKCCFLYFQAFREHNEIPVRELIRLWVAEGFIRKEEKSLENSAEKSLMELIDKSLVMVAKKSSNGGVKTCVVHDLLRDLCLNICNEVNFLKLVDRNNLIYLRAGCDLLSFQRSVTRFGHHVRSFRGYPPDSPIYVVNVQLLTEPNFQAELCCLHLVGTKFLVQLRFLVIPYLEAWIGSLVNLEYLHVRNNEKERYIIVNGDVGDDNDDYLPNAEIPSAILKLVKLRYFFLTNPVCFDKNYRSSQPNNLQFLSSVIIRNLNDVEILKCSPRLRKLKCKCKAFWVEEKGQYQYPNFGFFTELESLNMAIGRGRRTADTISLPSSIKKVTLSGSRLPWEKMSMIGGLPNLQVLKLLEDAVVGHVWETSDGEFQQLTFLKLRGLDLREWNVASSQHFPKLEQLVLSSCSLLEIATEVGEIGTLQLIEVEGRFLKSLAESAQQIEREQRDNGNEELKVILPHARDRYGREDESRFDIDFLS